MQRNSLRRLIVWAFSVGFVLLGLSRDAGACRRGPWGFAAFKYLVILGHAHFHIIFLHLSALHVLRTFRRIFEAGLSVNDFISKTKTQQRQVPSPVWSTLELQSDCAVNFNNNTPELIQNPRRKNTKLPAIANMFVGAPFFRIPFRASVPFWGTDQHVSITGMCVVAFSEKIIAFSCWALQLLTYWKNHCLVSNLIRSVFSCAGLEAFWSGIDCVGCPGHRDGHATR